jgi:hypothetical protein
MTEPAPQMASVTVPEKRPNDALAEVVAAKLKEKGFITQENEKEVLSKLKSGTASREDWKLWVDLATDAKAKGGYNGKG